MLRIMRIIAGPGLRMKAANGPALWGEGVTYLDPGKANLPMWFRGPRHWKADLSGFRVICPFRDPRDLACNQYWWALQRPNTHDAPEVAEGKRRQVEAGRLERNAASRNNASAYAGLRALSDGPLGDGVT